jgi:hypothetical protein
MTVRPTDAVNNAMSFYSALGLDVRYFAALWHTFNVGHMLSTDLDRICGQHGLSIADLASLAGGAVGPLVKARARRSARQIAKISLDALQVS